ncbi:hypothetical protein BCR44DRAFT_1058589 [Catenaria anguillulae PL171]|uniref:Uncharacterized protein n=1 Tax=Catenaria anguillulae PL171 TaxID=765915 RepID=A0A1Y2HQ45_9FUNG|nr:hypothetical protein BCR44DRAFT_1058589 [Catenaria anguillulae PL171]
MYDQRCESLAGPNMSREPTIINTKGITHVCKAITELDAIRQLDMPQLFLAIRCPECTTFQVDLMKNKPRFTCKICRAERSTDGVRVWICPRLSQTHPTTQHGPSHGHNASASTRRIHICRTSPCGARVAEKVQEARRQLNLDRQMRKLNQLRRDKEQAQEQQDGDVVAGSKSRRRVLVKSKSASTGSFGSSASAATPSMMPDHLKSSGSIVRPTLANAPLLAQKAQAEEEAKAATTLLANIEWDQDDFAFEEEFEEDSLSSAFVVVPDPLAEPSRTTSRTMSAPQAQSTTVVPGGRASSSTLLPVPPLRAACVDSRTLPPVKQPRSFPLSIEPSLTHGHYNRDPSPVSSKLSAVPVFVAAATLPCSFVTTGSAPNVSKGNAQSVESPGPLATSSSSGSSSIVPVGGPRHALAGGVTSRPSLPGMAGGIVAGGMGGSSKVRGGGEGLFTFFGKKRQQCPK